MSEERSTYEELCKVMCLLCRDRGREEARADEAEASLDKLVEATRKKVPTDDLLDTANRELAETHRLLADREAELGKAKAASAEVDRAGGDAPHEPALGLAGWIRAWADVTNDELSELRCRLDDAERDEGLRRVHERPETPEAHREAVRHVEGMPGSPSYNLRKAKEWAKEAGVEIREDPKAPPLYKCASPQCPGYGFKASDRPHPVLTCGPKPIHDLGGMGVPGAPSEES